MIFLYHLKKKNCLKMSIKNILLITGQQGYPIIKSLIETIKGFNIDVFKAPISISAFISKEMVENIFQKVNPNKYDLIMLPGFVQWDSSTLEKKYSILIRKGPEFASDIPYIIKNINKLELSTKIPANRLLRQSGEKEFQKLVAQNLKIAKSNLNALNFYINEKRSNIMISTYLPPPIIAEIVNCTEKNDDSIIKKVKHYINSGADIIDLGCVANKPRPERVREIIELIRKEFNILISIDSMDTNEILAAIDEDIDLILSLDFGNYEDFLCIKKKDIPIVLLPTNIKKAIFPRKPEDRVNNLIEITKIMRKNGFTKLIADPLLETPISPGICNSLEAYILYNKKTSLKEYEKLKLPLFFGISNVVELMDVDSIGINGILSSIAMELNIGILFTTEHSTKLMGGVAELKECVKLNYLAKWRKTPPINQGITMFKAKGKTSDVFPQFDLNKIISIEEVDRKYVPDKNCYFKISIDHYLKKIYVLVYNLKDELLNVFSGNDSETLGKRIIKENFTKNLYHINYLGRELKKAEICLKLGKPYIQDEE